MAAKEIKKNNNSSSSSSLSDKKRKQFPTPTSSSSFSKKPKFGTTSNPTNKKQPFDKTKKFPRPEGEKTEPPQSSRERRIRAKELAQERKKKRKRHYTLEQELALLWEKMRRRNIAKEERSKLVSEAIQKMKGKICEIAVSHVSSRILQTCVKYCSAEERETVFEELRPQLLTLACNTYAVHLVTKMLDNASKKQLDGFISSLHGHVASLLRNMVGSVVIEHAYQLGNGFQKQSLLLELYSAELQLFKDLVSMKERRLADLIPKLGLSKASVLRHMASVIQPILEKGIVDHSIIHTAILEFLNIADKFSAADVIEQLSGPLLVRMIHTKDGSKLGMLCIKHGGAKERKKIIKGMKGHIGKTALDQYGSMVLVCMLSTVDDTKLLTKIVIRELQPILKELVLHKGNGNDMSLDLILLKEPSKDGESSDKDVNFDSEANAVEDGNIGPENNIRMEGGGKKDPAVRRLELLVNSGLAESLIDTCIASVEELIRSQFGKEVIYEVATGGAGGILQQTLADKMKDLHKAIASLAALPKTEESEEHVLESFHSSRTIRKLVLDCPVFASILWKKALKGKCETLAQGHSCKVVAAFLESSDSNVRDMALPELQPLIDGGALKVPVTKVSAKEG
ncbi:hypothetical protein IFM89_032891 [Coptis chinensis]|uniref:PUM-HD domain-containing protein n=1 Tax=Coptis chinensis TaxID=261450 RepID=A0A835IRE2_9MAGN|nr:hypothetical protein IFM89_032891 [Coptis chinensis]